MGNQGRQRVQGQKVNRASGTSDCIQRKQLKSSVSILGLSNQRIWDNELEKIGL